MREGFLLLWLLALSASLVCWFYVEISLARHGRFPSRRKITGCELARQILDHQDLQRMVVTPLPARGRAHFGLHLDELLLSEAAYSGARLADLSTAVHESCHLLEEPKSWLPANVWGPAGRLFRRVVVGSWLLVIGGMLFPGGDGMRPLGEFLFVLVFVLACTSLGEEWQVTERAFRVLPQLEGLEIDELRRMKRLLKAMRWLPLAEVFGAPFLLLGSRKSRVPARV